MIKSLDEYIEFCKEMEVFQSFLDKRDGSYTSLLCKEQQEEYHNLGQWLEELKILRRERDREYALGLIDGVNALIEESNKADIDDIPFPSSLLSYLGNKIINTANQIKGNKHGSRAKRKKNIFT